MPVHLAHRDAAFVAVSRAPFPAALVAPGRPPWWPPMRHSRVLAEHTVTVAEVVAYRPGEFCRRELPPLRAVLAAIDELGLLVIDGYADLDPAGRPGLGVSAHRVFAVPVIGVAKSAFGTATHAVPVLRGTSARPLYVTAAGVPRAGDAQLVRHMTGRFRLPDALRRADQLARTGPTAPLQGSHRPGR
jgi:deoxyribonuclease V